MAGFVLLQVELRLGDTGFTWPTKPKLELAGPLKKNVLLWLAAARALAELDLTAQTGAQARVLSATKGSPTALYFLLLAKAHFKLVLGEGPVYFLRTVRISAAGPLSLNLL